MTTDATEALLAHAHVVDNTCECGHRYQPDRFSGRVPHVQIASHLVRVARPLIAAEVRAEVAAGIRAEASWVDALTITHQDRATATVLQIKREALLEAARIAEEGDQ